MQIRWASATRWASNGQWLGECYSLGEQGPMVGRVLLAGGMSQSLKLIFLS